MATKDISVIRDKKTGDIKNIRDKGIKDAKAKTAVAQTDAVRMKTVDDKEVYIDRNSLVQAIAEVMNSNSQSTIQTLFGADANGNHANINMANLASVLSDGYLPIKYVGKVTQMNFINQFNGITLAQCDGDVLGLPSGLWQILCWGTQNQRFVAIAIDQISFGIYGWSNNVAQFTKIV